MALNEGRSISSGDTAQADPIPVLARDRSTKAGA